MVNPAGAADRQHEVTLFNFDHQQERTQGGRPDQDGRPRPFCLRLCRGWFFLAAGKGEFLGAGLQFCAGGRKRNYTWPAGGDDCNRSSAGGTTRCRSPLARVPGELRQRRFPDLPTLLFDVRAGYPVSDASGKIRTPALPEGIQFFGIIEHPDYARKQGQACPLYFVFLLVSCFTSDSTVSRTSGRSGSRR